MARAPFQRDFTDEAGALLTGTVQVTMRREDDGTLPQLYPNFGNDDDPLGNPASFSGGRVKLHADGGWYEVTVVAGAYSRTFANQPVGLMQAQDYGAAAVPVATVATLPDPATVGAGALIYVSDDVGGAVLAFSDGSDWRRVTDRAVISAS